MFKKFRIRLTMLFLLLIGCSVLAAGIFTAKILENAHLKELRQNLEREIAIIQSLADWQTELHKPDPRRYFSDLAEYLERTAQARVTFVATDGRVLGDSEYDAQQMDNHLNREEIVMARERGSGYSIRFSETVNTKMLYVAQPLKREGSNEIEGYVRLSMSLAHVDETVRELWLGLIGGLVLLFAAAALVSYRVSLGLTRPLEKITDVANQIKQMNYKSRVHIGNKDEIGQLGHAINTMAESLQAQMQRIQEEESRLKSLLENMISGLLMIDREGKVELMNRSAEEMLGVSAKELLGKPFREYGQHRELVELSDRGWDLGEPVREELHLFYPQERIVEAHIVPIPGNDGTGAGAGLLIVLHDITAIRKLEKMRSEFVANVSHELKTPLAAVKGFAETLLAGAMDDRETARSFLQIIYDESERLNRLIGDILDLSKIESKRVQMRFSPVHLDSFVEKMLDMMRSAAEEKKIALVSHTGHDLYVEADEDRLQQILLNLISNGINYTQEGGRVTVSVEPAGEAEADGEYERIRITVEDTGIGIPKKDLPRIFERFYRVDKARSRSSGGTGLGLSIVKHLVDLHHGTIRVESELGVGSKFIIELPVVHA